MPKPKTPILIGLLTTSGDQILRPASLLVVDAATDTGSVVRIAGDAPETAVQVVESPSDIRNLLNDDYTECAETDLVVTSADFDSKDP